MRSDEALPRAAVAGPCSGWGAAREPTAGRALPLGPRADTSGVRQTGLALVPVRGHEDSTASSQYFYHFLYLHMHI